MSIIISENSFLYVKDIFGGDIPVFMKPLCRIYGFLTPEWLLERHNKTTYFLILLK